MATAKSTTPTLPARDRESGPEGDLLRAYRRLAPPEREKALRLILELERAADRQPERLRIH